MVSEKPWSSFSQADYSDAEWSAACLINLNKPGEHVKGLCKLPVKEPNGALNKNALGAAASVLAGGRGGVDAPAAAKKAAARKLLTLYRQADMTPPDSLKRLAQ